MTDFEKLLRILSASHVDFIVAGDVAAVAHGSARLTQDLDRVCVAELEALREEREASPE